MIIGRQIRAARALIDMSQDELAEASGLTPQAIRKIESGSVTPREGTIGDIVRVFRERGLEFTENSGVRLKPTGIEVFDGLDRFNDFYDFLYERLSADGGDVCLSIYDEHILAKLRKDPQIHRERMKTLFKRGDVTFRILTTKSDFVSYGYAQFRWQAQTQPTPTGFYAFGDCLALMSFIKPQSPYVIVIQSFPLAEGYRHGFENVWSTAPLSPPQKDLKS